MKSVYKNAKLFILSLVILSWFCFTGNLYAQKPAYLFSYFTGNGEDGLHLAYSKEGLSWNSLNQGKSFLTPSAGKDKLMRDPCIIQDPKGTFHMVWTVSWNERGIGYASSKDLIHWSEQKYLPVMEHESEARNCWAPEITYDKKNKNFMIYWATTIPGRFPLTESSKENKYNHRIYSASTTDFIHFTPTTLLYDHGFNVIDATITETENKFILFLKDETPEPPQKNIRIATADHLSGPYSKPSDPITGNYWAEGPTAIKIHDYWYVYFDKYRDHQYGAIRSKDLKNWEDISTLVHLPKGLRHGTIFKVKEKIVKKLIK